MTTKEIFNSLNEKSLSKHYCNAHLFLHQMVIDYNYFPTEDWDVLSIQEDNGIKVTIGWYEGDEEKEHSFIIDQTMYVNWITGVEEDDEMESLQQSTMEMLQYINFHIDEEKIGKQDLHRIVTHLEDIKKIIG